MTDRASTPRTSPRPASTRGTLARPLPIAVADDRATILDRDAATPAGEPAATDRIAIVAATAAVTAAEELDRTGAPAIDIHTEDNGIRTAPIVHASVTPAASTASATSAALPLSPETGAAARPAAAAAVSSGKLEIEAITGAPSEAVPATMTAVRRTMARSEVPDRFFRDMVTSMRNGVIAITREGHVAVLNTVACQALNLPSDPANLGGHYTDVLEGAPEVIRILAAAFESDHLPNRAELRLKSTNRVIGYTLSAIRDDDGRTIGAALFFKDLTRVEQLEERERLRDRLAALGEMAAAIAHEVKNPLAGIEVMAGLLKRRLAHQLDAQSMLSDIINEAKMANAIVLEVLEFVRPIRLQVESTGVARVLQDAQYMADNLVARGQTRIVQQFSEQLPPIEGDPHQLRQVFTNLLTNAYEALNGHGTVTLSARYVPLEEAASMDALAASPLILVEVADDGPGVPEELRDRIFSPFFTTKPRGSGLGLAIVRKIVDAHDGRITVSALASGGTRFRVALPVTGLPDRAKLPPARDAGAPGGPRQR